MAHSETTMSEALKQELKELIIQSLNLEDLTVDDIGDDMPLFSEEGLGLDSVDALELGLALKKKYNISLSSEAAETQRYFRTINSLAECVETFRGQ